MNELNIISIEEFKKNSKQYGLLHFSLVMEYNKSKNVGNGFIVDPSPTDLSNFYRDVDKQKEIDKENEKNERECMFKEDQHVKDMKFFIKTLNELQILNDPIDHLNKNKVNVVGELEYNY